MRAKIRLQWSAREMLRISGVTEFSKTSQSNRWLASSLRSFSMYASATVAAVGCLVLVGWLFDIATLKSVIPGLTPMKPNAAISFVLAGVSLLLLQKDPAGQRNLQIGRASALALALVGLLTLSEYLFGWNLGIDELLFKETLMASDTYFPGRMAASAALNFFLLALALLLLDVETTSGHRPAQFLTLAAALISLTALFGYAYDVESLYKIRFYTALALHAAGTFIVLSIGILLARPGRGFMESVTSEGSGGVMARRLLAAVILIPIILHGIVLTGSRLGLYETAFGLAILGVILVVILSAIILRSAKLLNLADEETGRAEEDLRAQAHQQAIIAAFGQRALVGTDISTLMDEAVTLVAQTLGVECCKVLELLPDGNALQLRAGVGWKEGYVGRATVGAGRDSQAGYTLLSDEPVIVDDLRTETRFRGPPLLHDHGVVSGMSVIIRGKARPFGVLGAHTTEQRTFTKNDIHFLQAIANLLAAAIERSEAEEEIQTNIERIQAQATELERANKVKDEFLSVMSHELRTPLNIVMGYTGMIKDKMLGEISQEQEKALRKVLSRSNDLLSMVSSIMQATSIEAGEIKVEIYEVSLGNFLDELRPAYEVTLDKELILNWDYPSDLPVVKSDSEKLKQILQNLISNAIKFTEKGNVTISARHIPEAKAVEFKVADTGIGIPKEALPVIFEKFRQADSSETRPYGGVGIGLYIVKKFTELLGGTVEVESELGKGSTFTVRIPCDTL